MPTTRINISGVIVDSMADVFADYFEFYRNLIDKGIITPLSSFLAKLGAVRDSDNLEVFVNSFGGDVFVANAMAIALRHWAAGHEGKLTVTVGSIAMSAAASIVVSCADSARIRAHRDSIMMFHSATTFTFGGPGAHKDAGLLLDKINDSIKQGLLRHTSLDKGTVDEWFQDSRMGWLFGDEITGCGLADELFDAPPPPAPVIHDDADIPEGMKGVRNFYVGQTSLLAGKSHNPGGIAIMSDTIDQRPEDAAPEVTPEATAPETAPEDAAQTTQPEAANEDSAPETAPENAAPEQNDETIELRQEIDNLKARCADLETAVQNKQAQLDKLTAGLRSPANAGPAAPATWKDVLSSIPANLPQQEWDREYLRLKKQHNDLFKQAYNL